MPLGESEGLISCPSVFWFWWWLFFHPPSRSLACRWMWRLMTSQAEVAVVATEAGGRFSHRPSSPAV